MEIENKETEQKNKRSIKEWWKNKKTSAKISFILAIIIFAIGIFFFFAWANGREVFGDEFGDKYLGVGVANGYVLIGQGIANTGVKWMYTLLIIVICTLLMFVVNFIVNIFCNRTKKSQTVGSLIKSLAKYIIVIVGIGFILAAWGVNVAGILAGVGVLTLIVGLGCQSLIQDVVAGMFIVFDDYYSVGDIVIIDGFRGVISDVGLKATKITDFGGNIKSINNSAISTMVNLSRQDSMITVTIGCAYEEDIVRVEGIIQGAMEDFKNKIPGITKGPFYKGIDCINASSIDFLVLCYSKEIDRYQVTRDLKRELVLLFKNNNVIIPYTQISVNPQNDNNRPQASEMEIALARKAIIEQRGIGKKEEKEKKSFIKKAAEALDKTNKELGEK